MRYMIVRYIQRPNGQFDEEVQVARSCRKRDLQEASVIVDFRKRRVEKAALGETSIPRNWETIVSYYYRYHPDTINQLCAYNGYTFEIKEIDDDVDESGTDSTINDSTKNKTNTN